MLKLLTHTNISVICEYDIISIWSNNNSLMEFSFILAFVTGRCEL